MPIGQTFNGTAGNDTLNGTGDDDTLYGLDGNDTLSGGLGADTMVGGRGDDRYWVYELGDIVVEKNGEGYDTVYSDVDFSLAGISIESLTLFGYGVTGTGNALDNFIYAMYGDNVVYGMGGNDFIMGGEGNDELQGGDGNDILFGETGDDLLAGGAGIDTANYERATQGVTVSLALTTAQNTGDGMDRLVGIENLYGSDFNDKLTGDLRNNSFKGWQGDDVIDGGAGRDTADYLGMWTGMTIDLALTGPQDLGVAGHDTLISIECLNGTAFSDSFSGNALSNTLSGNAGSDILRGRGGNDILMGGEGADRLSGGVGADRFAFSMADYATALQYADTIMDFRQSEHDKIDLSLLDANSLLGGQQHYSFIGNANFGFHAGELRYEMVNGNTLVTGDSNGDGAADFYLLLRGEIDLTGTDFVF